MKSTQTILRSGLLVGTLDISAACIQYFINTGKGPAGVFKFIASGAFGVSAFSGGWEMILAGLLFHYLIAFAFTHLFFLCYPALRALIKNTILIGIFYGLMVWVIMKGVVALSQAPVQAFSLKAAIISGAILIICIGLPLAFIAANPLNQVLKKRSVHRETRSFRVFSFPL